MNDAPQATKTDTPKVLLNLLLTGISLLCLIPLIMVISASFSDEATLRQTGYTILPQKISLSAYDVLFKYPHQLLAAYGVTIFVVVVGTLLGLIITGLLAYPLSRRNFRFRNIMSFYVFFTMLFSGGMVPLYIVVTQMFHLGNTIWVLILPYVVGGFNVLLMRTFFAEIPVEIIESAEMDGLNELGMFFRMIVPLSAPVLATVGLFMVLMYWNDFFLALLFIDNKNLYTLQLLLMGILNSGDLLSAIPNSVAVVFPTESMKMAVALISVGPMFFVFLFFQKYFVRGLTIGAIKG